MSGMTILTGIKAMIESSSDVEYDKHGFTKRKAISDEECILKALQNSRNTCGFDKEQVARLIKEHGGTVL